MATDRAAILTYWHEHPSDTAAQIAAHFGGEVKPATLRQWKKRHGSTSDSTTVQTELPLSTTDDPQPAKKREAELAELGLTPEEVEGRDMRHPGLTAERKDRIVKLLRLGVPQGVAARRAGITEVTYYLWKARGRDQADGLYREFLEQCDEALAIAETRLIGYLRVHAKSEWRAAKYLLESRFPQRWREHKIVEQQGANGEPPGPTVQVNVNASATAAVAGLQLASLSLEQLSALTGRKLETTPVVVADPENP